MTVPLFRRAIAACTLLTLMGGAVTRADDNDWERSAAGSAQSNAKITLSQPHRANRRDNVVFRTRRLNWQSN